MLISSIGDTYIIGQSRSGPNRSLSRVSVICSCIRGTGRASPSSVRGYVPFARPSTPSTVFLCSLIMDSRGKEVPPSVVNGHASFSNQSYARFPQRSFFPRARAVHLNYTRSARRVVERSRSRTKRNASFH